MTRGRMQSVLQHIRGLVVAQEAAGLEDSLLLERFLTQRDEAAFEALVRRHGPMVMGVCRRILRNPEDAEDAFQATFLVLVRKAGSIAKRELLGNWLYGVAYRTARAARSAADRRRAKEARPVARQQPPEEGAWQELLPLLDQELSRLPDKYRIPVIVCELEGKSRQAVARQLGLPEGTLSSRLARARAMLARRLAQRGVTLAAGGLAAGLSQQADSAIVPPSLISTTVKAGASVLPGQSAAGGAISANVVALSEGVVKTMFLSKLKIATAVLLVGSVFALGTGEAARQVWAARTAPAPQGAAEEASTAGGKPDSGHGDGHAPFAKSSVEDDRKAIIQQALETAEAIKNPIARLSMLLRIASVQSKMGRKSEARRLRQKALQIAKSLADGRSKVDALRDVAYAQAEGEDRSAALETLRQADQTATAIQDANERSNALDQLVMAHTWLKDYEGALRTIASMKQFENQPLAFIAGSIGKESGQTGRQVLKQVLQRAQSSSLNSDQPSPLIEIAAAYARLGDLRTALKVADTLGTDTFGNCKVLALERIGIAQAEAGDVAGAVQTLTAIDTAIDQDQQHPPRDNAGARARVLQAVALAQEKGGDLTAARTTFQKLRQLAMYLPPERPRRGYDLTRAWILAKNIVVTQVRLGDIEGAIQTASAIDMPFYKGKALLEIGKAQVDAGKLAEARENLLRAAGAVQCSPFGTGGYRSRQSSGPSEKTNILSSIAAQQAKAGDIKQALRTVQSLPANLPVRDWALGEIVRAQAKAGDISGALETLAQIQDDEGKAFRPEYKAFALECVVQAQVKAGDVRGALALTARQSSPVLKAHALLAIASAKADPNPTKK